MAQTTSALSPSATKVEISSNGSTYTDISGYANAVDPGDGQRDTSDTATFDGDTMIVTTGKRKSQDVKVSIIYTEGVSEGYNVVRQAYENNTPIWVRWSPKGGNTGNNQFVATGPVSKFSYPTSKADESKPIMCDFVVTTPKVTQATAA